MNYIQAYDLHNVTIMLQKCIKNCIHLHSFYYIKGNNSVFILCQGEMKKNPGAYLGTALEM